MFARSGLRFAPRFSRSYMNQTRNSLIQKYGITAVGVYGVISLVELPIFFGLIHYHGTEWMQDLELEIRTGLGYSTNKDDTFIHKVEETGQGRLLAELGAAFMLHKLFTVVRLPLTVAITPVVARRFKNFNQPFGSGKAQVSNPSQTSHLQTHKKPHQMQHSANHRSGDQQLKNFGTPPNQRKKWFSWFF